MEPLSAPELVTACTARAENPQGKQALTCRAFIQGYLSASTEVTSLEERPSPFVARAIRTRASRLSDEAEQRLNSRYCLPAALPVETLMDQVAALTQPLAQSAPAETALKLVLDAHYRCAEVTEQKSPQESQ